MSDLNEYEVQQPDGTTITMQLTDEDAERFPDAKKLGEVKQAETTRANRGDTEGSTVQSGDVPNRARRSK